MIHPTATVSPTATVGHNTRVWHLTQIGDRARVGDDCIIGSGVYIDRDVVVGNRVKIQTGAQLYHGTTIEDGVFVGPLVCLTNDKYPRAITPGGRLKTAHDWVVGQTRVRYGASLGAGAILLTDITVGRFAMVAAGSVVVANVPDHGLVAGTPARLIGYVCACGHRLQQDDRRHSATWTCSSCGADYRELADDGLRPAVVMASGESEKPIDRLGWPRERQ